MAGWPTPLLPKDEPLDRAGRQRFSNYRLDPVVDALYSLLDSWLAAPRQNGAEPPRVGLFGGLGQGKSSVVRCVLERLHENHQQRFKEWLWGHDRMWSFTRRLWGPPIARFDVSFFKADDLEWRFLTAVLWRRVLRNLILGSLILAVESAVLISVGMVTACWAFQSCFSNGSEAWIWLTVLIGALSPLALSVLSGMGTAVKGIKEHDPSSGLYLTRRDLLIQSFARFMLALPEVVVIDDLDRACVEQQRGFLRAIGRFSRELGFAVVVCMDESELVATPPNPEAPEELLRKTLNAELRIPDRSREDVVLLVMSCVREFVKDNPLHPLIPALKSVQFVADLTRVMLLQGTASTASPRKVQRLLTGLALHAGQLKVDGVDDLSALVRMDGLLQLAPCLRQHMDGLRQVLEANRLDKLQALLADAQAPDSQRSGVERFFSHTRMMQPSQRDGWFRLLGGLTMTEAEHSERATPWSTGWEIASHSHEFFRLFLEAIELDAAGYEHDLQLHRETQPSLRYKFELPGGVETIFEMETLPNGFQNPGDGYLGQCWVLWVCALATAQPCHKLALFERARRWLDIHSRSNPALADLFWRDCLADTGLWGCIDGSARLAWWNRVQEVAKQKNEEGAYLIGIERFFTIPLAPRDFSDAWSILTRPGNEVRDGRMALHWWRWLALEVDKGRQKKSGTIGLISLIWPAPLPASQDATGWHDVLLQHFQALNAVNGIKRQIPLIPEPLRYGWRRAQPFLDAWQCLGLLHSLAFDATAPVGMRWSTRAVEPWLKELDDTRIEELRTLLSGHPGEPGDARLLTLLMLCGLHNWKPSNVTTFVKGLPLNEMREIHKLLQDRGISPDWWPKRARHV